MKISTKLEQYWAYKLFTENLLKPKDQDRFINELCEVAELQFLSKIPREIGVGEIDSYLKIMGAKFKVDYDLSYLKRRWKKLFKTKVYKKIDNYVVQEIFRRDKNRCQYCNRTHILEIHHVIPKDKKYNGPNSYYNLV